MKLKLTLIALLTLTGIAAARFLRSPDITRIENDLNYASGDEEIHLIAKMLAAQNTLASTPCYMGIPSALATNGFVTHAANTINAISATPSTVSSQIRVTIDGTAIDLPAGTGYVIDTGNPAVSFSTAITITAIAGTATVATRHNTQP